MSAKSLADLIFRHYLRSALVPVLSVELVLITAYFAVNAWNNARTEATLREEVSLVLPHLARQEALLLDAGFSQISRETDRFASEHEAVLASPGSFRIHGEPPEIVQAGNGTWYQSNRQDGSGLFMSASSRMTPRQRQVATITAALDPVYEHVVKDVPNVVASYYNTSDNMNRLFPYIQKVWEQYPADLNMADYNFYYLADARHNPRRETVWTGAYLDPAGQGWMVSCVSPVYIGDSLHGVVGLDVTIEKIVKNLLGQKLPWNSSAFLVDDSGMILAMPNPVEDLLGLKELKAHVYSSAVHSEQLKPGEFNLRANPDTALAKSFAEILRSDDGRFSIQAQGKEAFLVQARIPETKWRLFLVARSEEVFRSVHQVAARARLVGWFVVAGMVLFYALFFAYLRRNARKMSSEISSPISRLAAATTMLGKKAGSSGEELGLSGIPEIDSLTGNFNALSRDLEQRSRELVESEVRERLAEKEAELAFAKGRFESASGYLHNIGNLAVKLGTCAMELEEIVQATGQYDEVFRRIREPGGDAVLERFEDVLVGRIVPRLKGCAKGVSEVMSGIHNTIGHQQRGFREGREILEPETFDLSAMVDRICDEFASWTEAGCTVLARSLEPGVTLRNHRYQLQDGIVNGLKNAFESIGPAKGRIEVHLARDASGKALLRIVDDGQGIVPEHRSRLLSAGFTTKPWGHGLGLHSFAVFLASHNGKLTLESPGHGLGATLAMEVGDV